MVSDITTQFAEGTVEYKPEPKEREGKDGPWTAYQIKVGESYYDCNKKVYEAVRKDEAIQFTYSTRHFTYKSGAKAGQEGEAYKISDLIGPGGSDYGLDGPPQTTSAPRTETQRTGMIGNLPGAEIGAMENRAWQEAMRVAGINEENGIRDEDYGALLMQQARMGSWFKAQQIPSAGEPEVVPLQDDPPEGVDFAKLNRKRQERSALNAVDGEPEPDWTDGPDPEMPF